MAPSHLIYEGKCKKIFEIQNHPEKVWIEFKDVLTAFNGKKHSSFKDKGSLNRDTTSLIFRHLSLEGIQSHWICDQDTSSMVAQKLKMIPLEVVVRNRLAGSTAKKFQRKEGEALTNPLFELYYKDEKLEDPFISFEQALMLQALQVEKHLKELKTQALTINKRLLSLFSKSKMDLIDFKLEFGWNHRKQMILGDEISADSCRIWKKGTQERLDKDRFRLDLGRVKESYQEIYQNLLMAQQ